jgi:hypothetical protein
MANQIQTPTFASAPAAQSASQPTPIQPPTVEEVKVLGNALAVKREALKALKAEYRDKIAAANEEIVEAQDKFYPMYEKYLLAGVAERENIIMQLKQQQAQQAAQASVPAPTQAPVSTPLATIPEEEPIAVQSAQTVRMAQARADNLSVAPGVNLGQ